MSNYLITAYRLGLKVFRRSVPTVIKLGLHNSIQQTLPRTTQIFLEKRKLKKITFFKRALQGKRNEAKVAEDCWRAIKHAAGRSFCGRSSSSVFEFGIHLDSFIYILYIPDNMCTQFRLSLDHPECNNCVSCWVSLCGLVNNLCRSTCEMS